MELEDGIVHLWSFALEVSEERLAALRAVLAPEERERAERFRFALHRHRFTVGRAALRHILSGYTGRDPAALRFAYGERGKPSLPEHPETHFNLSHSADRALLGVSPIGPLGVDVEKVRPLDHMLDIAERFFSPAEYRRLASVAPAERPRAFFNCWTRKEAYIKAVGEGLAIPLDRFEVTLLPGEPARFVTFQDPREHLDQWSLIALRPSPETIGAAAWRSPEGTVKRFTWEP